MIHSIFLSIVFSVHNQSSDVVKFIHQISELASKIVSDYEMIIVDNASTDDTVEVLKKLTEPSGIANLQVYALTSQIDPITAAWVGMESSLGDYVVVIDPMVDDITLIPQMIDKAVGGSDIVIAINNQNQKQTFVYWGASLVFHVLYKWLNGANFSKNAPNYRLLSRRLINFIFQHRQPAITYRHLPISTGFSRAIINYQSNSFTKVNKSWSENIDDGMRLLVSTTRAPMRIVTTLSLFGAIANLFYMLYVLFIATFESNVASGWVSISLQQSGMFFLISLVLLVLGEYILHMASLSNEGPLYHVAQEFTSTRMTYREKLNIEEISTAEKSNIFITGNSKK